MAERGRGTYELLLGRFAGFVGTFFVPIVLVRRTPAAEAPRQKPLGELPVRRDTYLDRPELELGVLAALRQTRLVSVTGLPGIGKTELARESARRAQQDGLVQRVGFVDVTVHGNLGQVAAELGQQLSGQAAEDAPQLARMLDAVPEGLLLYLDNAEDLIVRYSRAMNRARQDAITTEIMEIVGGAEAMRAAKADGSDLLVDHALMSADVLSDRLEPSRK